MSGKRIIISLALGVTVILGAVILTSIVSKHCAKKVSAAAARAEKGKAVKSAKKELSQDMAGLTVRILNVEKGEMSLKIRAFKSDDARTSTYAASFTANKMQELSPGVYDIEIDVIPQKLYKGIKLTVRKETVEDLGCITGAVNVKVVDSKKKDARYAVRVLDQRRGLLVTSGFTNRLIDVMPGSYDIEIGTMPKQIRKDVRVEKGKSADMDLGSISGRLLVRTMDDNKTAVRYYFRIRRPDNNEIVTTNLAGIPVEILKGTYAVEALSNPPQVRKDVEVRAGEETTVEFLVKPSPVPARPATAPALPVKRLKSKYSATQINMKN